MRFPAGRIDPSDARPGAAPTATRRSRLWLTLEEPIVELRLNLSNRLSEPLNIRGVDKIARRGSYGRYLSAPRTPGSEF